MAVFDINSEGKVHTSYKFKLHENLSVGTSPDEDRPLLGNLRLLGMKTAPAVGGTGVGRRHFCDGQSDLSGSEVNLTSLSWPAHHKIASGSGGTSLSYSDTSKLLHSFLHGSKHVEWGSDQLRISRGLVVVRDRIVVGLLIIHGPGIDTSGTGSSSSNSGTSETS